jgi:hypothetical protein
MHTAIAGGGRVFIGTTEGIDAVKAADGSKAWRLQLNHGLWNAPLLSANILYIAARNGEVMAIHADTRQPIWSTKLDSAFLGSFALNAKAQRLYIGCEDMRVYALDARIGQWIWRSDKLPGVSFRGYYPVVAPDGSVMITVTPCAGGDAMQDVLLDMTKEVFGQFASWRIKSEEDKKRIRAESFELMKKPETYEKQLDYLRKRLTDEPALQTFFVLDPKTGKAKFVTPIVYAESLNGPAMPPLVTPDGKVIVKYNALLRSRYEHYSPFLNVGYLDTTTGHIAPIMDQTRTYGWHDSLLLVHDEQSQLSIAADTLINTHQDNVNALDLKTLEGYKQPWATGVHEVKPGVAASLWANVLHGTPLPSGWEWLPRGTAVYGGGSAIDVPVTICGDSFYFLPTHEISAGVALIACRIDPDGKPIPRAPDPVEKLSRADAAKIRDLKWDWDTLESPRLNLTLQGLSEKIPGTRQNPLTEEATRRVAKITDAELDPLILRFNRRFGIGIFPTDPRLATAVEALISADWRPLLFPAAKAPAEAYRLFSDPTETLYTLALAYPHLAPELQTKVKARVAELSALGGPLDGPIGRKSYDPAAGQIRSAYDEAPAKLLKMGNDVARSDTARIYPLYLWAAVSDDWKHISLHWSAMKKLINPNPEKNEPDLGNGRLSGLIAACRIAQQFKDDAALTALLPQTRLALRDRLQYEFAHTQGGLITIAANQHSIFGRWRNLNPDLAHILSTYAKDIHQHLMDVYVDYHRPAWFVAWNVELMWRNEAPFSFPTMSNEIFAARAAILHHPATQLEKYIDIPWCKADEYYIQKLALLSDVANQ